MPEDPDSAANHGAGSDRTSFCFEVTVACDKNLVLTVLGSADATHFSGCGTAANN